MRRPLGVIEAENKREAHILAEHLMHQRQVIREAGTYPLYVSFIAPSVTLADIVKWARGMEAIGGTVEATFIRDRDGRPDGIRLLGRIR